MTPFQAYLMFLAMKRHWTDSNYCYHKYLGKVNASYSAFEKRKDQYHFGKLAKHQDLEGFLISSFIHFNPKSVYPGGIAFNNEYQEAYAKWKKRIDAVEFNLKQEINALQKEDFVVKQGQHPKALIKYFNKELSLESLTILNKELKFFEYWNEKIYDNVVWPDVREKALKYQGFLKYNRPKVKQILKEQFNHS
ncbi:DNA helicase [Caulobacter phage Cr30]|uniref:DNA helicase n=1 Tax=Caulobacter phage Cr30 TaxID=1357714 RepID=UPI0004A9B8AE|nr:DNA helicase [Caulobacter phage Cr30]AGS81148.1 DNA helicase [Caulobacter phage Cr30]